MQIPPPKKSLPVYLRYRNGPGPSSASSRCLSAHLRRTRNPVVTQSSAGSGLHCAPSRHPLAENHLQKKPGRVSEKHKLITSESCARTPHIRIVHIAAKLDICLCKSSTVKHFHFGVMPYLLHMSLKAVNYSDFTLVKVWVMS